MRWLAAFGWLPVPVFYLPRLFADGFAPLAAILIRSDFRTDEGLHRHELKHVEQFYALTAMLAAINVPLALILANTLTLPVAPDISLWSVGATVAILCATVHPLLYLGSRAYRLAAEVAAYREQLRWPGRHGVPMTLDAAAAHLARDYRLGITPAEAKAALDG